MSAEILEAQTQLLRTQLEYRMAKHRQNRRPVLAYRPLLATAEQCQQLHPGRNYREFTQSCIRGYERFKIAHRLQVEKDVKQAYANLIEAEQVLSELRKHV